MSTSYPPLLLIFSNHKIIRSVLIIFVAIFFFLSCENKIPEIDPDINKLNLEITFDKPSVDNLTLDFGYVKVGLENPPEEVITVKNIAKSEVDILFQIQAGSVFTRKSTSSCKTNMALKPGTSCELVMRFWPKTFGDATLRVTAKSNNTTKNIAILKGRGLNNGQLQASTPALNFNERSEGNDNKIRIVRLSNDYVEERDQQLKYKFSIPSSNAFLVDNNSTTCVDNGTLDYDASCFVGFKMSPTLSPNNTYTAKAVFKTATCADLNIDNCTDNLSISLTGTVVAGNTLIDTSSPEMRQNFLMSAMGNILYLFGGEKFYDFTQAVNEFWSYDTTTKNWRPVPLINAPKVAKSDMYNMGDKLVVLPSSDNGTIDENTYIIDPSAKTVTPAGLGAKLKRTNYASAISDDNTTIYLFGGDDGAGTQYNDLYKYTAASGWVQVMINHDSLSGAAMVFYGGELFLYGGDNSSTGDPVTSNKFWKYNIASNSWSVVNMTGTRPPALSGHKMAVDGTKMYIYDSGAKKLYFSSAPFNAWAVKDITLNIEELVFAKVASGLFAYGTEGFDNNLYKVADDNFSFVTPLKTFLPLALDNHSITRVNNKSDNNSGVQAYIYTATQDEDGFGRILKYSFATKEYSECKTDIAIFPHTGTTFTTIGNRSYIVGGSDDNGATCSSAIYQITPSDNDICATEVIEITGFKERCLHAATNYNNMLYIFGGVNSAGEKNKELVRIDFNTKKLELLSSDVPFGARQLSGMAELNGKLYFYGGEDNTSMAVGGLWSYDVNKREWKDLGFDDIKRKASSFIAANDRLYIIGGIDELGSEKSDIYSIDINATPLTAVEITGTTGDYKKFKGRTYFINLDDNLFGAYSITTSLYNF